MQAYIISFVVCKLHKKSFTLIIEKTVYANANKTGVGHNDRTSVQLVLRFVYHCKNAYFTGKLKVFTWRKMSRCTSWFDSIWPEDGKFGVHRWRSNDMYTFVPSYNNYLIVPASRTVNTFHMIRQYIYWWEVYRVL